MSIVVKTVKCLKEKKEKKEGLKQITNNSIVNLSSAQETVIMDKLRTTEQKVKTIIKCEKAKNQLAREGDKKIC
jgi:hypothetical protein